MSDDTTRTPAEIRLLREGYAAALRGECWPELSVVHRAAVAYPMPQVERRRETVRPRTGTRYRVSEDGEWVECLIPTSGRWTRHIRTGIVRALADLLDRTTEMVDADQVDAGE